VIICNLDYLQYSHTMCWDIFFHLSKKRRSEISSISLHVFKNTEGSIIHCHQLCGAKI